MSREASISAIQTPSNEKLRAACTRQVNANGSAGSNTSIEEQETLDHKPAAEDPFALAAFFLAFFFIRFFWLAVNIAFQLVVRWSAAASAKEAIEDEMS